MHERPLKIGLFGGSFDPPHAGHLALAMAGLDVAGLDEVWIIPANPVHRTLSGHAGAEQRLRWIKQLFHGVAHIRVIDWEIKVEEPTPTIDTLRRFRREFPQHQFWLMLGTDAWTGLPTWQGYPEHRQLCSIAVFARTGMDNLPRHAGWLETEHISDIFQTGSWRYFPVALPDISATALRHDAASGRSLRERVPEVIRPAVEQAYQGMKNNSTGMPDAGVIVRNATEQDTLEALTSAIVEALEDKKAADVLVIDVRGRCDFTDRFVLASGRSDRQLKALANSVSEAGHKFELPAKIEGLEAAEWILVDLGDVVVHLFLPDVRESFQLERLWAVPTGTTTAS